MIPTPHHYDIVDILSAEDDFKRPLKVSVPFQRIMFFELNDRSNLVNLLIADNTDQAILVTRGLSFASTGGGYANLQMVKKYVDDGGGIYLNSLIRTISPAELTKWSSSLKADISKTTDYSGGYLAEFKKWCLSTPGSPW